MVCFDKYGNRLRILAIYCIFYFKRKNYMKNKYNNKKVFAERLKTLVK